MPEAFVLQTLRTARTKASPRCGFAGATGAILLGRVVDELERRDGRYGATGGTAWRR